MKDERGPGAPGCARLPVLAPHYNRVRVLRATTDPGRTVERLPMRSEVYRPWPTTNWIFWGVDIEDSMREAHNGA